MFPVGEGTRVDATGGAAAGSVLGVGRERGRDMVMCLVGESESGEASQEREIH